MKKVKDDEFFCRCDRKGSKGHEDEDGKYTKRCDEVLNAARKYVAKHRPLDDDIDFVNRLLYWIVLEHELHLGADQWAGVGVTLQKWNSETKTLDKGKSCWLQCDSIIDGLAGALLWIEQETGGNEELRSSSEVSA